MNFPWGPRPQQSPATTEPTVAEAVTRLHAELAADLERIAWAILRDWPLAADAVQETFSLLAVKLGDIPVAQRPGWLIRTVQYQSQNIRRKKQRADRLVQPASHSRLLRDTAGDPTDDRRLEQVEEHQRLRQAIADLPAAQREVVCLRLTDEQTFAEIAEQLNVPLGTVLSRMRLALQKLKAKLE